MIKPWHSVADRSIRGKRCLFHRDTALWSCSSARRSGVFRTNPSLARNRGICLGWSLTPNSLLIRTRTRGTVQRSDSNPKSIAGFRRRATSFIISCCFNLGRAPGAFVDFKTANLPADISVPIQKQWNGSTSSQKQCLRPGCLARPASWQSYASPPASRDRWNNPSFEICPRIKYSMLGEHRLLNNVTYYSKFLLQTFLKSLQMAYALNEGFRLQT